VNDDTDSDSSDRTISKSASKFRIPAPTQDSNGSARGPTQAIHLYRELLVAAQSRQTITVQKIRGELEQYIPKDRGMPTSLGSIVHFEDPIGHRCVPCEAFSQGMCQKGTSCMSCHMPHDNGYCQLSNGYCDNGDGGYPTKDGSSKRKSSRSDREGATHHDVAGDDVAMMDFTSQKVSELLTRPNVADRVNAATALGKQNCKLSSEALDLGSKALVKALKDPHFKVRAAASNALGSLGPDAECHSAQLEEMLDDSYFEVRAAAALAIGKLGGRGPPSRGDLQRATALVGALKDKQHLVRATAASAIGNLGLSHPVPANGLAAVLSDSNATVRAAAAYSLGKLGDSAVAHAGALAAMLRDENAKVRESGAHAMGRLETTAIPYMGQLVAVLNDEHPCVRGAAANALGNLGDLAKPYAADLARMLQDSNVDVCASAAFAFGKLDDAAAPFIGILKEMVHDSRAKIRKAAGCALGKLGHQVVTKDGSRIYEVNDHKPPVKGFLTEQYYQDGAVISL
jgi:HEAT repeat protein